jgi:hypothetical protein
LRLRIFATITLFVAALTAGQAQWLKHPTSGIPRTKDGKANLFAPIPRTSKGQPDLSGIWMTDGSPREEMDRLFPDLGTFAVPGDDPRFFSKYFLNIFADVEPEAVPLRPQAAELLQQRLKEGFAREVPTSHCLPAGIPMGDLLPAPRQFIQLPGLLVILYEGINPQRLIYTDGRKHPADPWPSWLGYSIGKWERDTLVVDTIGFNDRTWLDAMGHPRTEAMRLTERFRRRDFGHMEVDVTIDDPQAYTKPFSFRYTQTLLADTELLEYVCAENEKDRARIVDQ